MKLLRYLKNPQRHSVSIRQFQKTNMSFYTVQHSTCKDYLELEVEDDFVGAIVEYIGDNDGSWDDFCLIEKSVISLIGFSQRFLGERLRDPILCRTEMLLNIRYTLCKTQWDFVLAKASKLSTVIDIKTLPEGITDLPVYSISGPSRAAVLVKNRKIVDFVFGSGLNTPVLLGVSKNGYISFRLNYHNKTTIPEIESFSGEVPEDEKPAFIKQSAYI